MNTNKEVEWRRCIVPKKVEEIIDHLFIDTYKSNNIKIGVNDMTVNDSEMSARWKSQAYKQGNENEITQRANGSDCIVWLRSLDS